MKRISPFVFVERKFVFKSVIRIDAVADAVWPRRDDSAAIAELHLVEGARHEKLAAANAEAIEGGAHARELCACVTVCQGNNRAPERGIGEAHECPFIEVVA